MAGLIGSEIRLGFIGAGRMATALARGWLAAGLFRPEQILASDPVPACREAFAGGASLRTTQNNREVLRESNLVLLAVKPQMMDGVLNEIRGEVTGRHLVVSIAAGITLAHLAGGLGADRRLIRVMPNTPCLVGASASGYSPGDRATPEDVTLVDRLLNAVGKAIRLPENLLDAVTGLSGGGPAFVYLIIEALADGGVRVGLPREAALTLAAQTVLGAARMVLETGQHPGVLKDMVASAGGTTIVGLHALERAGVRAGLMDAVEVATNRAHELAAQAKEG
jgi:pyrroline-5-carboxylate reductase